MQPSPLQPAACHGNVRLTALPTHTSHNRTDYSARRSRTHKSCSITSALNRPDARLVHFSRGSAKLRPQQRKSHTFHTHTPTHLDPIGLRKSSWWLLTISQSPVNMGRGERETRAVVRDLMDLGLRFTLVTLAWRAWSCSAIGANNGHGIGVCCWRGAKSRRSEVLAPGQGIHTDTDAHTHRTASNVELHREHKYTHRGIHFSFPKSVLCCFLFRYWKKCVLNKIFMKTKNFNASVLWCRTSEFCSVPSWRFLRVNTNVYFNILTVIRSLFYLVNNKSITIND